jgi:hypothetical protein
MARIREKVVCLGFALWFCLVLLVLGPLGPGKSCVSWFGWTTLVLRAHEKTDVEERSKEFLHIGFLFNESPGHLPRCSLTSRPRNAVSRRLVFMSHLRPLTTVRDHTDFEL